MLHNSRFDIESVPVVWRAGPVDHERVVLERHEGEVLEMAVGLQVINESAHP